MKVLSPNQIPHDLTSYLPVGRSINAEWTIDVMSQDEPVASLRTAQLSPQKAHCGPNQLDILVDYWPMKQ